MSHVDDTTIILSANDSEEISYALVQFVHMKIEDMEKSPYPDLAKKLLSYYVLPIQQFLDQVTSNIDPQYRLTIKRIEELKSKYRELLDKHDL